MFIILSFICHFFSTIRRFFIISERKFHYHRGGWKGQDLLYAHDKKAVSPHIEFTAWNATNQWLITGEMVLLILLFRQKYIYTLIISLSIIFLLINPL